MDDAFAQLMESGAEWANFHKATLPRIETDGMEVLTRDITHELADLIPHDNVPHWSDAVGYEAPEDIDMVAEHGTWGT